MARHSELLTAEIRLEGLERERDFLKGGVGGIVKRGCRVHYGDVTLRWLGDIALCQFHRPIHQCFLRH